MSSLCLKSDIHKLSLLTQVYFLQKELNMEVMVMDEMIKAMIKKKMQANVAHSAPSWLDLWLHKLHILKQLKGLYRTSRLLDFHTMPWKRTCGSSKSCSRKETIGATIAEYCSIMQYQVALLQKDRSASGLIQLVLKSVISFTIKDDKGRPALPGDRDPTSRKLLWLDKIKFNTVFSSALMFNIIEENLSMIRALSHKHDKDAINKVVTALKSCPASWRVKGMYRSNNTTSSDHSDDNDNNNNSKMLSGVIPKISQAISAIAKVGLMNISCSFGCSDLCIHRCMYTTHSNVMRRTSTQTPMSARTG